MDRLDIESWRGHVEAQTTLHDLYDRGQSKTCNMEDAAKVEADNELGCWQWQVKETVL